VYRAGDLGALHGERKLASSGFNFAIASDTRSVMSVLIV
jgi:hypothetical protein